MADRARSRCGILGVRRMDSVKTFSIKRKRNKRSLEKNILDTRSKGERWIFAVAFAVLGIHCLTLLIPVAWMLMSILKTSEEYLFGNPFALPSEWLFSNFWEAFDSLHTTDGVTFFEMLFNSIWYTVLATFLSVFMPATTGYVMSKYKFRGREFIFAVAVTAMILPIVGTSAAYLKFMMDTGMYDTPLYVVWQFLGGFTGQFLVYYGYFRSVSWEYAEAAKIDGAGHFSIYFKIMLPQAVPVLLTYTIVNFITHWNEYQNVLLYLPSFPTLAAGLFSYGEIAKRSGNFPQYFAGLFISMIPTLLLFAFFSKRIMGSVSLGGLKG